MAPITAKRAANYILRCMHDSGEPISNLKLQKLLYYAQGWHLALKDEPLFNERIEAWVHGPAVPPVYGSFKQWSWQPIDWDPGKVDLPAPAKEHLDRVLERYGPLTAFHLEQLTHREAPWLKARKGIADDEPSHAVISCESMRAYFRRQLKGR